MDGWAGTAGQQVCQVVELAALLGERPSAQVPEGG